MPEHKVIFSLTKKQSMHLKKLFGCLDDVDGRGMVIGQFHEDEDRGCSFVVAAFVDYEKAISVQNAFGIEEGHIGEAGICFEVNVDI